jgi:uncharacterized protein YndB with AHSA1/START domain
MLKKLFIVFLVLVVIVGAFAGFVAIQPAEFRVVRSATIAAPPAEVFGHVNDFHSWKAWSPWEKLDPAAKNTFEGPAAGKGAMFTWSGNDEIGAGKMTLIESQPNDLIKIKLEFKRPFEATNDVEFTFKEKDKTTLVTWTMVGQKNFFVKAVGLFMNMDKMVGDQFEEGLANLTAVAEQRKR